MADTAWSTSEDFVMHSARLAHPYCGQVAIDAPYAMGTQVMVAAQYMMESAIYAAGRPQCLPAAYMPNGDLAANYYAAMPCYYADSVVPISYNVPVPMLAASFLQPPAKSPIHTQPTSDAEPTTSDYESESVSSSSPQHSVYALKLQHFQYNGCDISQRLCFIWHQQFEQLFSGLPHNWTLCSRKLNPYIDTTSFFQWDDEAKVRFTCQKEQCQQVWTSQRGAVSFWCDLNQHTGEGLVVFDLFSQKCQKCRSETPAWWYTEQIHAVISRLHSMVQQKFYGREKLELPDKAAKLRQSNPRRHHIKELCSACSQGRCRNGSTSTGAAVRS